jgi:CRP/FNR family transcriptional regulator
VSSDVPGVPARYRDVFRTTAFWAQAPDEVLDRLAAASTVHQCRRGEVICREGSRPDRVIVVLAGFVRSVHYPPSGHVVLLENSGPGEVLGPIGAFADTPFESDLEAGADTVVATFPVSLLEEIIQSDPIVAMSVIRGLARRWVSVVGITKRNSAEVPTRLARYLLGLKALNSNSASLLVELPCSRAELAVMLATTPETLSRTFHRLADEHVLETYERTVRVLNVPELERIAAEEAPE